MQNTSMIKFAIGKIAEGQKGTARGSKERLAAMIYDIDNDCGATCLIHGFIKVAEIAEHYASVRQNSNLNPEGNSKVDPFGMEAKSSFSMIVLLQTIMNKIIKVQMEYRDRLASESKISEMKDAVNNGYDIHEYLANKTGLKDPLSEEALALIVTSDYYILKDIWEDFIQVDERYRTQIEPLAMYAKWENIGKDPASGKDMLAITETATTYSEAIDLYKKAQEEYLLRNAQEAKAKLTDKASVWSEKSKAHAMMVQAELSRLAAEESAKNPEDILIEEEEKVA